MRVAVTVLAICVASLLALGMVMLYSSSMTQAGMKFLEMQLMWCGLGLTACMLGASFDYRSLKKIAWPLLALAAFLLLLVFIPHIGHGSHGAHRWVGFHGFFIQPSEFARVALIIVLAWYCEHFQRQMPTFKRGILIPGVFVGLILALIFIEPDRGTTILLATVSAGMLLIAGVRWKFLIPPLLLGIAGLAISLLRDPMRMKRIFSWLHPEELKDGVGYQSYQAMIALGSGGWFGLGLGNSRQKLGFVPEQQTDFILSIIGEELGLIATLLVVLAFLVIVICGLRIAFKARDTFGLLLALGLTLLIGLQAAINIGVATSALPNKGMPLPFISYGGSNLLAMLTCVGMLFSIARYSQGGDKVGKQTGGISAR